MAYICTYICVSHCVGVYVCVGMGVGCSLKCFYCLLLRVKFCHCHALFMATPATWLLLPLDPVLFFVDMPSS